MTLEDFVHVRTPAWAELDRLVEEAGRRPQRLGAERVRALGALYRSAAADLATARRRYPGESATLRLEQRVGRARHLVYASPARRASLLSWFTRGYWQAVRAQRRYLALAAVLLLGSGALSALWADRDPAAANNLAPGTYQAVTRPRPHDANLHLPPSTRSEMASEIFTNNIRVTLISFAGGVTAGIGTVLVLLLNGLELGVVGGLAVQTGNGRVFFELVTAHGVLELSCIVVAAAAGLRLGWALVEPGRRTRPQAVGDAARRGIQVVLGTAPWLVVAGLVEGFLTPAGLGLPAVVGIGAGLGALYWTLVLVLGRTRRAPAPSP